MADSEKKKRKSKTEAPLSAPTETAPAKEPVDESASKSKRKSKKSEAVPLDSVKTGAEQAVEAQEKTATNSKSESAPEAEDTATKTKKKSRKSVSEATSEIEQEEGKTTTSKRRKSSVGKAEKVKHKNKDASADVAAEEVESEQKNVEEAEVDEASSKKKKKKAAKEAKEAEEKKAAAAAVVDGEADAYGEEYQEEYEGEYEEEYENDEVERTTSAPPPRFPPPSAPRKTPSGPVAQGPDVGSVFSMKPTIKIEVGEVEEAHEYDAEDVKREIDFEPFCAEKPNYTIGSEVDGTAYFRMWTADNKEAPKHVVVKFYSNEPPRLIPEASIVAHVQLLKTLAPSSPNILPLLDEFIGEDYVEPTKPSAGKDSASSSEGAEPVSEPTEVPETSNPADSETPSKKKKKRSKENAEEKPEEAEEEKKREENAKKAAETQVEEEAKSKDKKKDKKDKKSKNKEETHRPVPTAAPVVGEQKTSSAKAKTFEPDHILVFEALPDVTSYAIKHAETHSEKTVAKIVKGLLKALGGVHAAGYMHRAVTPVNVVVTEDGEPRLTGFDMATRIAQPEGNVMASEKFKAPEIANEPTHDQTVDLWGVGTIAYFLLTGKPAFRESNYARLKIAIRDVNVLYEPEDWDSISSDAQSFCKALIIKDPKERMGIAAALEHPWITNTPDTLLPNAIKHLKA